MKRLLIGGIICLILIALLTAGVNAQLIQDSCSVKNVKIENEIVSAGAHSKINYNFECSGASSYQGQVTKMLVTLPYKGVKNLEASDSYGSMEVLKGPKYTGLSEDETESTIGVMFRKGLLIRNQTENYKLTIEFDTTELVSTSESGVSTLKPEGLASSPKITIIAKGVTETKLPVQKVDYKLNLPEGAAVQKTTKGCKINEGVILCEDHTPEELNSVEVKWKGGSGTEKIPFTDIIKKVLSQGRKSAPSIINIVKTVAGRVAERVPDES